MDLDILYEDNHLIIVNKKSGDITQGDKTGDETLPDKVKKNIKERYNKPGEVFLGVVHRLDRPTSGIVIFAKTSKALSRMNELFRKDKVEKIYWAVIESKPPVAADTLIHYLEKNEKQNKSYAYIQERKNSKKAILDYKLLSSSDNYSLLEIVLKTGRHHQIRSQLNAINIKIKGDLKYGAKRSNPDGSISLHSRKVKFIHPVSKKTIEIIAPLPDDKIWHILDKSITTN